MYLLFYIMIILCLVCHMLMVGRAIYSFWISIEASTVFVLVLVVLSEGAGNDGPT